MPTLRALAANIVFYLNTALWAIVCIPALLGPRTWSRTCMKSWAMCSMWLIRLTAGIRWEIRGVENLPRDEKGMTGFILASKHQSAWETFALLPLLDDPAYILKKELMHIPLYGWYAAKAGMIPVARGSHAKALRQMTKDAKAAIEDGRQIIIFPEGTRKAVGDEPDYKPGAIHLYRQLEVPIVPVALNSGLFWPRRKFERHPGTLVVSILPPIPAGLNNREVGERLQLAIETETVRLIEDAR